MEYNAQYKPSPKDRIYLRVPTKIAATLLVDNHFYAKVIVKDLSSTGLSFATLERIKIPHTFEIVLRIPGNLLRTRLVVEVQNSIEKEDGQRIGCSFADISSKEKETVSSYLLRFTEFSPACKVFSMAAFFLFVDGLLRIFTWLVSIYYKEAHVEYPFIRYQWCIYGITLLLYAASSFIACLYSCDIKKRRFLLSMACGILSLIFILAKYFFYCKLALWGIKLTAVKVFFWAESCLIAYVIYAVALFIGSQKKMGFIADSLGNYQKGFREKV